jgi:nucleoid DNA-binding protein
MARRATTKAKAGSAAPKATAIRDKMTKTRILTHIAAETGLTRVQVEQVLSSLELLIYRHIKKRAVGEFTLPGLLKIRAVKRPATKKRMGRNPATGEAVEVAAKPATTRVRITGLKKLKEMVL